MLANLAMLSADNDIQQVAHKRSVTYTRYADDLTFSSADTKFTRAQAMGLIADVCGALRKRGLRPNPKKTVIAPPGARKIVLGLLVDGDKPRLPRQFRDRIRQHVYYLRKFGPAGHATRRRFDSVRGLRLHVEGLVQFAHSVDPAFADRARDAAMDVDWP